MKILLPVDGSEGALAAVRHALQLKAQGLRARFVLVNVQEPPTLYEMAVAHDALRLKALQAAAGADLLARPEALLGGGGVEFESEVAVGEPVNALLELAENYGCALIVLGARGMGSPERGGLGSVATGLVQRAPLPVTVVHRPAD
jgi:nucleotide-binding universal stress UspA family protein